MGRKAIGPFAKANGSLAPEGDVKDEKSIKQIEACKILLKSHITRIENYKGLQKKD